MQIPFKTPSFKKRHSPGGEERSFLFIALPVLADKDLCFLRKIGFTFHFIDIHSKHSHKYLMFPNSVTQFDYIYIYP